MLNTISDIWKENKELINGKSLEQILKFSGDGQLKDNNITCNELRAFLNILPLAKLEEFINECLTTTFESAGYALQDLVNELGKRLGFDVEYGLYKGKKGFVGFDGFWKSTDNDIIVEVKTTDTYSINLDTIANYRNNLIEEKRTKMTNSSILLIVGRKDTGGLEAQIRGSKHAWDIRLISIDSLIKLIKLKEELIDDENTFKYICRILRPLEFTRLDYLIDTIFVTGKDVQAIEDNDALLNSDLQSTTLDSEQIKVIPVNFHDSCILNIEKYLNFKLNKQTKTLYDNKENNIGLTCAVSKNHGTQGNFKYWFAFHPYQKESLAKYDKSFVCFGCGDESNIFVFPYKEFLTYLDKMWTTNNGSRMYWHIHIIRKNTDNRYMLIRGEKDYIDITNKKI